MGEIDASTKIPTQLEGFFYPISYHRLGILSTPGYYLSAYFLPMQTHGLFSACA